MSMSHEVQAAAGGAVAIDSPISVSAHGGLVTEQDRPIQAGLQSVLDLRNLVAITTDLFSGEPTVLTECDPESPEDWYVVFRVRASGDAGDILDRECLWHQRIAELGDSFIGKLRLSIVTDND